MKDLSLKCFTDCLLGELSSWWNWHRNLTNMPKPVWEQNCLAFKQSTHALLSLGTTQGYSKEEVFDFALSQLGKDFWLVKENVNLTELKSEFFKIN